MSTPGMPTGKIRVDILFMFSNHKDVRKTSIEKRQRKLLEKVPFINAFLAPDEKVLLVSPCISPTSLFGIHSFGKEAPLAAGGGVTSNIFG